MACLISASGPNGDPFLPVSVVKVNSYLKKGPQRLSSSSNLVTICAFSSMIKHHFQGKSDERFGDYQINIFDPYPGNSPDLNLVLNSGQFLESVWTCRSPQTDQLGALIKEEWIPISQEADIQHATASFRNF